MPASRRTTTTSVKIYPDNEPVVEPAKKPARKRAARRAVPSVPSFSHAGPTAPAAESTISTQLPTEPVQEDSLGARANVTTRSGGLVAYPGAVRRQRAARAARPATRRAPAPLEVRNVLDELPLALRKLAMRTGDVRKVRPTRTPSGSLAIEMDIATARALRLVQ